MRIVPRLDEVEDGGFGLALRSEAMLNEQLAFERGVKALTHRVVVAIAARTHRGANAGGFAAKSESDRRVLRSLIGMVNDSERFTPIDRHVERVDHELFAHVIRHRPTDNATAEDVEHDGEIQEAAPCRDVRDVGDPELIRSIGGEAAFDKIGSWSSVFVAYGRNCGLAPRSPVNARIAHQSCNTLGADANAVVAQLCVNAWTAIRGTRSTKNRLDPIAEQHVLLGVLRR